MDNEFKNIFVANTVDTSLYVYVPEKESCLMSSRVGRAPDPLTFPLASSDLEARVFIIGSTPVEVLDAPHPMVNYRTQLSSGRCTGRVPDCGATTTCGG